MTKKKPINAREVAEPVVSYAQMVSANVVMLVPRSEITWPSHTIVNPNMPMGRLLGLLDVDLNVLTVFFVGHIDDLSFNSCVNRFN